MAKQHTTVVGYEGNTQSIEYAIPENETGLWGANFDYSIVGKKNIPRLDAVEKVTGKAKYSYDINRPNMLHAVVLTCPYAHAHFEVTDTSEAEKMPGVKSIEVFDEGGKGTARFAGWLIAMAAAETIQQARDAARKIKVNYKVLPFVIDPDEAMDDASPRVNRGGNVNPPEARARDRGDVDQGFQEAEVIVEGVYTTQVQTHSCLETHGCVAEWNGDEVTVWHSTQGIWSVAGGIASGLKDLGLQQNNVRVITQYMGGGFGSKFGPEPFGVLCALVAKKVGRPVKMMLDRYTDTVYAGNKPGSKMYVKLGAKKDGKLTAIHVKAYNYPGHSGGSSVAIPFMEHYDCENIRIEEQNVMTNAGASRAFRAPGRPQGSFGIEMALEELAMKLEMDSYELKAKNVSGTTYKAVPYELKLGAEKFGWKEKSKKHGSENGKIKHGVGCAVTFWHSTGQDKGASVRCTLYPDGSVEVANGCQDLGTGQRTMMAIVAAEELGIDVGFIKVSIGDTQLGLNGPASGGSTTTPTTSPVVRNACYQAKLKLYEKIATKWKTEASDIDCKNGTVFSKSHSDKKMSWKDAAAMLRNSAITATADGFTKPDVPGSNTGAYGAQFAEVEVDTETGKVRCTRIVAVQDCGKTIAKKQAESQICGAVIQGVACALYEDRIMDNMAGRQINPNMEEYKIPGIKETPDIETVIVDVYDPVVNTGGKGLGEPPAIPTGGAIGCAVANAIGVPIRDLPITPDKVLAALQRKEG
ncbi:MAG: xanthine dehydrogenase family protein molybdopterin-binding subunit [Candidatus Omnitrophota bacterium]|jgi:xanthine dehydrogenase YagR molybdenum-binding subunit|nr:MAG: xanthine dehydrogenase family protein molybdopterin-binding subunit [Candidatus Omnitrophota bacterium]